MRRLVPLAVLLLAGAVPAAAHAQASSSFAQLTGHAACVVQTLPSDYYGADTSLGTQCAKGHGLIQADAVAVSPDQTGVYAAAGGTSRAGSNAVVSFARDAATGALKETGCTSDDGGDGLCTDGDALGGANDVAISPDGANVYVASGTSNALAWFDRDKMTGALTQA